MPTVLVCRECAIPVRLRAGDHIGPRAELMPATRMSYLSSGRRIGADNPECDIRTWHTPRSFFFSAEDTMSVRDDSTNDELDDAELLAREQDDRDDFQRRQQEEPRYDTTTYGVVRATPSLNADGERGV